MKRKINILVFTLAVVLIVATACTRSGLEVVSEEEEKQFQRGKSLLREGREQEALNAFLKVIESRQDAAESHLDTGRLYLNYVKDPIAAIYHFRRYLELKPDSAQAKIVIQLVETAKKEFARTLPGQPFDSAMDRIDLLEIVEALKKEILVLKQQLAAVKRQAGNVADVAVAFEVEPSTRRESGTTPSPSQVGQGEQTPGGEHPGNYVVKPGDTLTRISIEVYGNPGRWMDIYQANRDQLSSPHDLQVGEELKIP